MPAAALSATPGAQVAPLEQIGTLLTDIAGTRQGTRS
jgi:hypothetical protein